MVFVEVVFWICVFIIICLFGATAFLWDWAGFRVYWILKDLPSISNIPIVGDTLRLAGVSNEDILVFLEGHAERKLRYLKAMILGAPDVLLFHPDDIEKLLSSTVNIKKGFEYFPMKPWLGEGLLLSDGSKWRQRRKLLTPTFHFRILEDNVSQVAGYSSQFVEKLLAFQGKPIKAEDLIRLYTLDVICETAMGLRINALENGANSYVEAIKSAANTVVKRSLKIWLKDDRIFNLTPSGKRFKKDLNILHTFTEEVIKSRKVERQKEKEEEKDNQRKAFLDILLEAEEKDPGSLTSLDIREEVDTFMFEGHDTTSAALTFALYELAKHPNIQDQAFEEQKRIFGTEKRKLTMQDLKEMVYLEMVIKEVLRLYPSVPFISRELIQDLTLGDGRVLPAGVNAIIVPYLVHRNIEYWSDPLEFRPERFLPGNNRHLFSYIPFSAGPRNCIGMKFAMLEMKATLSSVIRSCRIQPVTNKIKLFPNVILQSAVPIVIRVQPRE